MEKLFIWGTGFLSEQMFAHNDIFDWYDVIGFIDNDIKKVGKEYFGKKVYAPDILLEIIPDRIVILTDHYEEIRGQIEREYIDLLNVVENKDFFYKKAILLRYKNNVDPDMASILDYLRKNDLWVFNDEFVKKYHNLKIDVFQDDSCGLFYVMHNGVKLYFARFLDTEIKVMTYYRSLLIEQDENSPHRYMDDCFHVIEGDVVVDVGVGEGNFSLDVVEKASKVYMIETNEGWVEALKKTFKDYMDKIVIIQKYISSIDYGSKVSTLDGLIHESVNFIKMDIEGSECDALQGAKELIGRSPNLKCAICAYHGDFDEIVIKKHLTDYGMECSTTKGYMWFQNRVGQSCISAKLRRGIVRASKSVCEETRWK